MLFACAAETRNHGAGFATHPRHEASAVRCFRVAVRVIGQHFVKNEVLDLTKRAPGSDVIGIDKLFWAVGAFDLRVRSDQPLAQIGKVTDEISAKPGQGSFS